MSADANGIELKDLTTTASDPESTTVNLAGDSNANNKVDISLSDKEDTVNLAPEATSASASSTSATSVGASVIGQVRNVMGDSAGNGMNAILGNPMVQNAIMQVKGKFFDNGEGGIDSLDIKSAMSAKIVLRPWLSEFAQVAKPATFEPAQLVRNMNYFRWNYVIVTFAVLVLGLLMSPTALLSLLMSAGGWLYFLHKNSNPEWQPKIPFVNKEITPQMRMYGMGGVTSLFLVFMIGSLIFMLLGFGVVVCVAHGVAHVPVKDYSQVLEAESEDSVPMTGSIEGV